MQAFLGRKFVGLNLATAAVTADALVSIPGYGISGGPNAKPPASSLGRPAAPLGSASGSTSTRPTGTQKPQSSTCFTVASGGDILLHLSVNHHAKTAEGYDCTKLLKAIQPWIEGSDPSLCALGVPIAPPGEKPSNYSAFGSPPQITDSFKAMGWDGCALATNHSMDQGFKGVSSTIDNFKGVGLGHAGTVRIRDEPPEIQYYTVRSGGRDVVVTHLSAITLTNGAPFPKEKEWSWNVVGDQRRRAVKDLVVDAKRARKAGASTAVVSMHWGTEYVAQPIAEQKKIGRELAGSGEIDLVFGNHSCVAESVTTLKDGPDGCGMPVVWSMSNTISGQLVESHGHDMVMGLMTTATIEVPAKGKPHVTGLEWTTLAQDQRTFKVFPSAELKKGARPQGMTFSRAGIEAREKIIYPVMTTGSQSERTEVPKPQGQLVGNRRK